MKLKLPLVAAFVALVSLTACGGGGSSGSSTGTTPTNTAADVSTFSTTDTTVGTGPAVIAGKTASVTYTGWLYSATAADHKGTQFDAGNFDFVVGSGRVISGFDRGVLGMQAGGKRTVVIPSNLGYGTTGQGAVPPNAGLVFEVTLTKLQ